MKILNASIEIIGYIYLFPTEKCYTTSHIHSDILSSIYSVVQLKPTLDVIERLKLSCNKYYNNTLIVLQDNELLNDDMKVYINNNKSNYLDNKLSFI